MKKHEAVYEIPIRIAGAMTPMLIINEGEHITLRFGDPLNINMQLSKNEARNLHTILAKFA